ncbi:MAG: sugar phosphate isomerase/epimerase [Planctomycetes bacterium]|nr:sugar phosphate isomerase/epimerase [Planctomycetota bacterium]
MTLPIGFSTLACPDWSWREILENGVQFGYDGVEVRLVRGETDLLQVPEFRADQLEGRRRELAEAGFRVCGLASSVRFDHPDAAERQRQVETGRAYIDLARELGAGFVRVFGDVLPENADAAARATAIGRIADGLNTLGEAAERTDVEILLETHGDFFDSRLVQETFARVTSPAVGVLWDTHHPWRFCGEPLSETFERLRPWVRHTHWKDSVPLPRRPQGAASADAAAKAHTLMSGHKHADYVLFGGGEFPAEECLRLLAAANYDGWLSLEWEKAWHPEIEGPETALPLFPGKIRRLWELARFA